MAQGEFSIIQGACCKDSKKKEQMLRLPQLSSTVSDPAVSAMAQVESNIVQAAAEKIKEEQQRLKYLAVIQVASVSAALGFSNLYVYGKERTGPLKPAVNIVEGIVSRVVRLIFDKYFDDPVRLLKLFNPNVGEFVTKIDGLVPPVIQHVSSKAISAAQRAPGMAGGVPTEVQRAGVIEEELWLKYLTFVQVAAVLATLCLTNLFLYAKERSGALKPGIEFVEGMVKNMFQLVFDKYFGDPKVGEFVTKIDGLVPPVIKQVSSEAFSAAQKAAGVAGGVSTDVQHAGAGLVSTASGFIKQVSPEAFSAVQKAPGVAEGLATKVERAGAVFNSVTKIDSLVSPVFNQVSLEAISAAQNAPGGAGDVTTEVQHAGVLGTASGFIKQVSSEAILSAQNAPGVAAGVGTLLQHVGVVGEPVAEVDDLVPSVIKQVTSEAILAAQRAPGVAGGVATLLQHVGVVGEPVAEVDDLVPSVIKQVSSEAISIAQKAPAVGGGVATEVQGAGVASTSPGFLRQVSFEAISAAQTAPGVAGGVTTEVQHAGVLGTASGFIKQVSSEAISGAQKAPGVAGGVAASLQHVGVVGESVVEFDDLVPSVIKQVSSEPISAAQKAPAVGGGVATEVQRAGVASTSPGFLRQVSSEAISAAQKAPGVSRGVATELQHAGILNTVSGFAKSVAKGLYTKYEPKAEQYAVSTWRKLNHLPLFPQVASVVVPTAAYFTDKYNQTVVSRAEKGYKVALYLPLVPTEKIAKVFSEEKLQS